MICQMERACKCVSKKWQRSEEASGGVLKKPTVAGATEEESNIEDAVKGL